MSQSMNLSILPNYSQISCLYFSQNDVGRTATINLIDADRQPYSIPVGSTVKIQATKPSGLGFSESCSFSDNVVTVISTATMTAEMGRFPCEIKITHNSDIIGSADFMFCVEKNPHPDDITDGTAASVLNDITVAFNDAMYQIQHSGGLTSAIKTALLNCFQNVAWINGNGQTLYNALSSALYAVTKVTLNAETLLFNSLGATQQLTASLVPPDSLETVSWSSSDSSVATVSSSGLVTSVADGSATITASVGNVSDTCSVTVLELAVQSISAVLNAGGHTFYVGDDISTIKPYLTVTATYNDSTTAVIPSASYTLSGSLSQVGANTITVTYEGITTTVSVTAVAVQLVSISAVYTQGGGTVYDNDSLDSLKSDLVVTATYDDSSTATIASADYTLSGTLTVGTSTITVSYGGKTTTFTVNVTEYSPSQGEIFGTFTSKISLSKVTTSTHYPSLAPFVYKNNNQTARACMSAPIENKGYTITVTDSTKYSVNAVDVTSLELLNIPNQNPTGNPDGTGYSCGNKTVGWNTTDSVSTPYLWIAIKKNNNTNFTADELQNGAEAVFTYTKS